MAQVFHIYGEYPNGKGLNHNNALANAEDTHLARSNTIMALRIENASGKQWIHSQKTQRTLLQWGRA